MNGNLVERPRRRADRRVLALLLVVVVVAGPFGTPRASAEFNGDSCEGEAPAIVVNPLATTRIESTPETPARFEMLRLTLDPGHGGPASVETGHILFTVDSGAVTLRIDGEAMLTRYDATATRFWSDPAPASGPEELRFRDQLSVPAGVVVSIENDGLVPAKLLLASVAAVSSGTMSGQPAAGDPGVVRELLASGVFLEMPRSPAMLAISRVIYAGGASDAGPTANGGPLLIAVERGEIGYQLSDGDNAVVVSSAGSTVPVKAESAITLQNGDSVVEGAGVSSRFFNQSTERAWILLATIIPERYSNTDVACRPAGALAEFHQ